MMIILITIQIFQILVAQYSILPPIKKKINVDTGTNKIVANYPTVFYIEQDSQINFDISFFIFESYLMNISSTTFTITTSVSEINGMPPTNSATSTNNVGPLYVEQMSESNSILHMD